MADGSSRKMDGKALGMLGGRPQELDLGTEVAVDCAMVILLYQELEI